MSLPLQPIHAIKADVSQFLRVARERHRRGDDPFRVTEGLSDGVDGIIRQLFRGVLDADQDKIALLAVGGYGRRELCPYSDVDLVFVWDRDRPAAKIEQLVRLLWDGGFQLGHSVRTPAECYQYMADNHVTAAALLEHRFLCGSEALRDRFHGTAINRFRKRKGESFAREKLVQLRASLDGPGRTIYVLQPHLKDGCCGLRDIQRVLWVENIRRGEGTFEALQRGGSFESDDLEALRQAYGFYLRVRCELHFRNGVKQDILERDSLVDVAEKLGYRGDPRTVAERFLADLFHHSRSVHGFLRHYIETGTRGRRFFAKLSHKIFGEERHPLLVRESDLLFPSSEIPDEGHEEAILDAFLYAQREGLRVSESLIRAMRQKIASTDENYAHSPLANACLVELLKGPQSGRILKSMHSAGILSRIIPEFRALDGLVTFDGHHQFTVDEHTLRALEYLDRIAESDPEVPERFREIARRIGDLFPLRLALLLHDIGKGSPGVDHHAVTGGETAVLVCERLGLDEIVTELVEFLVYRHLSMFRVSENQDYGEPQVIESFARLVGTEERLRMLYLLTYIDIRCVGPGTWTLWKGVQLEDVYERTCAALASSSPAAADAGPRLEEAGFDEDLRREIAEHCRRIDHPSYARDILPERMAGHVDLVRELQRTGRSQVGHESFGEYHEVAFCSFDRPRLFADYSGLLFSEGFNVLGARIFSRSDGIALDVFFIEVADGMNVGIDERVERMRKKLARLDAKEVVIEDLIRQWRRSFRFRRLKRGAPPVFPTKVSFDNTTSPRSTLIEVVAGDRPGLLYDLASALRRLELDVRTAKVSTMCDRARDVFYVVEADGHKVTNPARRKEIEDTLASEVRESSSALAG